MIKFARFSDALPPLVIMAVSVLILVTSYDYGEQSAAMPRAVAIIAIVLCLLELLTQGEHAAGRALRQVFSGSSAPQTPGFDGHAGERPKIRHEFAAFAWIVGFLVFAIVAGFYVAIPVYVFSYLRFYARASTFVSAAMAIALVAFLFTLFRALLGYQIFGGLIAGDFL